LTELPPKWKVIGAIHFGPIPLHSLKSWPGCDSMHSLAALDPALKVSFKTTNALWRSSTWMCFIKF
jgi:hypothetical protein